MNSFLHPLGLLDRQELRALKRATPQDVARLRFPDVLEAAFLRYYDGRFRSWFRIASGVIALFYGLRLAMGLWAPEVKEMLAGWFGGTMLGTVLLASVAGALSFTRAPLHRLQLITMPGFVVAALSSYFLTAPTLILGQLSPTFQLIFQVMLAIVIGFRVRFGPAAPLLVVMSGFMLGASWLATGELQARAISQASGSLLFSLTLAYLFERDARRDFIQRMLIHQLATTDELSGALNRRCFLEQVERMARESHGVALVMLDLDHFKSINDGFGHLAGDEALRQLVAVCRDSVREEDLIGRLGGEEFALALPGASLADAGRIAERVREKLAATTIAHDDDRFSITSSFGVAIWLDEDRSVEDLLGRADRRLYMAKRAGRNRVVVSEATVNSQELLPTERDQRAVTPPRREAARRAAPQDEPKTER